MKFHIFLSAIFIYFFNIVPLSAQDFDKATKAYQAGDYVTAINEFKLLAKQGNSFAQNNLGYFYTNGIGGPIDYPQAFKWYKMSAEQGYAYAQLALGNAYLYGNGVQQNDMMAYTWFELASINGRDEANAYIKALSKRMSQKNISDAKIIINECTSSNYDRCSLVYLEQDKVTQNVNASFQTKDMISDIISEISSEIDSFKFIQNQNWGYSYSDKGIACLMGRYVEPYGNIEDLSNDELLELMDKRIDGTLYLGHTFFDISYFKNRKIMALGFYNSNLNNSPGRELKVTFDFDNQVRKTIFGAVPTYNVSWMSSMFKNPNPSWFVGIPHKDFYREILPLFKKSYEVTIGVNGKILDTISLRGFTKSFNMLDACTNREITFDLNDPF